MNSYLRTWGLLTLTLVLLLQTACAKSLQADAGAKASEHPVPKAVSAGAAGPASDASIPASPVSSPDAPYFSEPSGPSGPSDPTPSEPAPSLSISSATGSGSQGTGGGVAEDLPGDLMIARVEPSEATQRQLDEIKQEQAATALAGLKDVYFGFDSWVITEQGRLALNADAEWLRANPNKKVTIEGHCDERGTQAYNLVLGEKRAKAVRNYLVELGIAPDRLAVVSYGKDRPICRDHSEPCHQQNRRGHLAVRVR